MTDDPFRPPGYTFLLQDEMATTQEQALTLARLVFPKVALSRAKVVAGSIVSRGRRGGEPGCCYKRETRPHGYRVYIPGNEKKPDFGDPNS